VNSLSLKTKIIDESLRLFSYKGYINTSVTDILEASGSSKGGFYNHFKSKEALFHASLSKARQLWRERNLNGVEAMDHPLLKIKRILENYRDHYLTDQDNFPGGCIFVNLAVELNDQAPELAAQVNEGFTRLKKMITRLLNDARESGSLVEKSDIKQVTELIFSGLLGACVMYTSDKSEENLHYTIESLINQLAQISKEPL
jgi:AcrR family transcriptional regulator